jgi:hypothetical protein
MAEKKKHGFFVSMRPEVQAYWEERAKKEFRDRKDEVGKFLHEATTKLMEAPQDG